MARKTRENKEIREFILNNIETYPNSITLMAVDKFGLSRVAINGYLKRLEEQGLIESRGQTQSKRYSLKKTVYEVFEIELSKGLPEDVVWRYRIAPLIHHVKQNVIDICNYCFTEILNNSIDHSGSKTALISYTQTANEISIGITDYGIGIFNKLQKDFNLLDTRTALLELAKGKITSDKDNHAGQGIFFTSRMLDRFTILSGDLFYSRERTIDDEWLIETADKEEDFKGTSIRMNININTDRTTREVFDLYQGADLSFRKTHVPLKLSKYPGEELVSRSQAKRVLSRFTAFTEVMLDFKGVSEIGQGFADEIFRVFKNGHPQIKIVVVNTTKEIDDMINFVQNNNKI